MKRKITFVLVIALVVSVLAGCGEQGEPLSWSGLLLGDQLPVLEGAVGEVRTNTLEKLELKVQDMSEMKFGEYMVKCQKFGFTIDVDQGYGDDYIAFNEKGYKIELSFLIDTMDIILTTPMEMGEFEWPESDLTENVPAPASSIGKVYSSSENYFSVYVGEMTKEDYTAYVEECKEAGFDVDCNESENAFYADNEDGVSLQVSYEGNNVIFIVVQIRGAESTTDTEEPEATEPEDEEDDDEIRKDFKEAMDAYESFMNKYVAFMKKYQDNPTDVSLLTDYASYMSEYAEFAEAFEKWEDEDLNDAELEYYVDVEARVAKKLLEVAS